MIIENVTLPVVPDGTNNMDVHSLYNFIKHETFTKQQFDNEYVVYLKLVFDATCNPVNWKNPVSIDTRFLTWEQIQWVQAAIFWYHACGVEDIRVETGVIVSPGYQAW